MVSNGNRQVLPPEPQELEVSVFGPGFGECVVLHLGNGDWGVVDSCLDRASKRPAALHYLESLGLNVESSVRFVVATHWHDDHIQGIKEVFDQAKRAVFSCTEAVRQPDFEEVLGAWEGTRYLAGGSGVDELRGVIAALKHRNPGTRYPSPRWASANKVLWERLARPSATIKALSPSDAAVMAAIARLRTEAPKPTGIRRRYPNIEPNDSSVVLSLEVEGHNMLLGSDLQVRQDRGLGWMAIVDGIEAGTGLHQVFKVAHHGSPNGDHDGVWDRMLVPQPWAVATPFVSGDVQLPSFDDTSRIVKRTRNAYLTASPQPMKFRDLNRTVEKAVKEATLSTQLVPGRYGQVRLRKRFDELGNSAWGVELFGDAISMEDYVLATH